ncbi:protein FUN34 [Spathaspora passalidarum NRRL Y-27907]|uniref:Protein FUN34 n=1 Tax=Spathaspora passalidarum (strain NRRL Y-27907 / 11-Y1) TaxID=619300 RepID=G3AL83_SPAPN|nr:protein FUN34 [Spathaspora passalidarum NRRL Y-27907]EGW33126.1 protein FUN34 [Spathaspora passalidarum NRRL Y-27907]
MSDNQQLEIESKEGPSGLTPDHPDHPVTKVQTDGDYVQFGNERYLRSELVEAFGGTLNPGLSPPPKHDFANPAPLGLSAFALTTFVLSLINCEARGVTIPNIVVGLAFFYGGAAQLVAGMFEIAVGNTFGGVALSSYGGFWGSWAAIQVDAFGIKAAYAEEPKQFANAIGIFLIGWFIFTFFMMLMTVKSTVAFFMVFFLLTITFLLLAISEFNGSTAVKKAGGVFGLLTAFTAWYNAYAGIANPQNSYITIKGVQLPDFQNRV